METCTSKAFIWFRRIRRVCAVCIKRRGECTSECEPETACQDHQHQTGKARRGGWLTEGAEDNEGKRVTQEKLQQASQRHEHTTLVQRTSLIAGAPSHHFKFRRYPTKK